MLCYSATGGAFFLNKTCEMRLGLQKKLLRFIQICTYCKVEGNTLEQVDVRFVGTTARDPLVEVREGRTEDNS